MTGQIDITPEERAIVLRILNEIVPDREVRAFGSRVTGKAKPFSDLDLAVMGDEPLPLETRAQLDEAFSESDLPWKVDVLDWAQTEQGFQEAIKENSLSLTKTYSTLIRHASNCMNTQSQHLSPYKLQLASLGELADNATGSIAIGPFGSRMKADCYVSSGMPVIRGTNLVHGRKWAGDWVYVPLELADTMPNCQVNAGDIVFPHRGAIGEVGIVPDDGNTYLISSSLMKIKLDRTKSEPDFIYYYFSSQAGREEILKFSSSVGTPGIGQPLTSMRQFKIPRFPLQVQKSIASILGAFDNKIDLNRRTNETLEAMARALFRDWFVDFGPTRAKMAGEAPYLAPELWELFPDRLDDEGKPEGWLDGTLEDIANLQNGYAFKSSDWLVDGIPVVKIGAVKPSVVDLKNVSFVDSKFLKEKPNFILKSGDILIGLTGYVGEVGRVPPSQLTPMLNQRVARFLPEASFYAYIFCIGRQKEFKEFVENQAHGSAQANVSTKDVLTYPIVIPTMNLSALFDENVGLILEKIDENLSEIDTLTQLRDLLLPKLMSGEISIRDAEKIVEDAA